MTLDQFIENLQNIKESLKDKEIFIIAENGLLMEPKIKPVLVDPLNPYDTSGENVKHLVVNYQQ